MEDARWKMEDLPPISTFPEFNIRPSSGPSVLHPQMVLDTLYMAAGLALSMYGISQYVVAPMTDSLTRARRSLAQTARENVGRLNANLEAMVSEIPVSAVVTGDGGHDDQAKPVRSETSSDSDPTELFHLDAGTQTTPSLSRATSSSSGKCLRSGGIARVDGQAGRLRHLRRQLAEMVDAADRPAHAEASLTGSIGDVNAYLDTLNDRRPSQTRPPFFGQAASSVGKDDDPSSIVRTEIRTIKSSLLTARTFPDGLVRSRQLR